MEDAEDAPEKKKQKRAAQILAEAPARFEVHNGSGEQRAGQLFKIRLENFMCHENFEMEFGFCTPWPHLRGG